MKRKILFLLLFVCLAILPNGVFAANVVKVNETEYATIKEAVDIAKNGDVITILDNASGKDINLGSGVKLVIPSGKILTLSGSNVVAAGDIVENHGNIIVDDGTLDISKLTYGDTGLIPNLPGTITIKDNGRVAMLDAWAGAWTPVSDSHILTNCEAGGIITVGTKTFAYNGTAWVEANTQIIKGSNVTYGDFQTVIASAETGSTLKLLSNVSLPSETIVIDGGRTLTVDLNGYNISATKQVLKIKNANVTFTGKGKVYETAPYLSPIVVIGSTNEADTNYTVVTVGKDVTLEGWSGLMIDRVKIAESGVNKFYGYGIVVNANGTLKGLNDTGGGTGIGIYINGSLKSKTNYPVVNVSSTAKISATGIGIYAAGYAKWNIGQATITGVESGLAIKSGIINIDGTKITGTGIATLPPVGYTNGINASGAAIQIESNKGYAGDIELDIKSGTFTSEKSVTLYEYVVAETTDTSVKSISITGGTFMATSAGNIVISEELSTKIKGFVTGGSYSTDVKVFVAPGYQLKYKDLNAVLADVNKVNLSTGKLTVSGTITNGNNANVQLIQGGVVIKSVTASDTGVYSIPSVAAGVYNIIATNGNNSITKLIEVKENLTQNLTIGTGSFSTFMAGSVAPNIVVGGLQEQYADKKVSFLIKDNNSTVSETKIKEIATSKKTTFFDLYIRVDDDMIDETNAVIEMVIPFDLKTRSDIEIFRYHNGAAEKFTKLTAKPTGDYTDKTFYLDKENNLIYVYSSKFSTYGIGYNENQVSNPDTNDNILLYVGLGALSLMGLAIIAAKKRKVNI